LREERTGKKRSDGDRKSGGIGFQRGAPIMEASAAADKSRTPLRKNAWPTLVAGELQRLLRTFSLEISNGAANTLPPPCFLEVLILKNFKSFEPEVLILQDFKSLFPEVLILVDFKCLLMSGLQKIEDLLEVLILEALPTKK
jgi:hypothetical protein